MQAGVGNSVYEPSYLLLKESRESWDQIVSDKLVYSFDPLDIALDSLVEIPKDYLEGNVWMEFHFTFEGERDAHYAAIIEANVGHKFLRKLEVDGSPMRRDSAMLVDIAQFIEPPQEMGFDGCGVSSVIRLKRINNGRCLCGYSRGLLGKPFEAVGIGLTQDGKLGSFGISDRQVCEIPNKLIQRSPETIQQIAHEEGDQVRGFIDFDAKAVPSLFRVYLFKKLIRFGFVKGVKFLPQSVKVYLRPTCLEIGISQTHEVSPPHMIGEDFQNTGSIPSSYIS